MQKTISILFVLLITVVSISKAQTVNLTNGLTMYLPFTGNATDASGGGNIVSVSGATLVADRFGTPNAAYGFDGVDDYMAVALGPGMRPQYPFSFSCWVNLASAPATALNFLFSNDYTIPGTNYAGALFNMPSGSMQATVGNNGPTNPSNRRSKTTTFTASTGTWYHVGAVVNSATDMRLFINCVEVEGDYSGSGTGLVYSTGNTGIIGRGNGGTGENFIDGSIDELRFYNRALNDAEIKALYFYPTPPPQLAFALPVQTLEIQCGSPATIDATQQGIISYTWSDNTTGPIKTFTTGGTYIVEASDGCLTRKDTVIVTANNQPTAVVIPTQLRACIGQATELTATGAATYTWFPAAGLSSTTGPSVTATITDTTTYNVVGTGPCGTDTATVILNAVPYAEPIFTLTIDDCTKNAIAINNNVVPQVSYWWLSDEDHFLTTTNAWFDFEEIGNHEITLIANEGTTCADTAKQSIDVPLPDPPLIYIPNSFTPNNDGTNDVFGIYTTQYCLIGMLYIYNCWGEMVYITANPFGDYWNGKFKGEDAYPGVYAYKLELSDKTLYKGKITLVR